MSSSNEIQEWVKLRDLSADQLQQKLGLAKETQAPDRSYSKLNPVMKWHDPQRHPAHFIFQDGKLVLIYVDEQSAMSKLNVETLRRDFGTPDAQLRSRAGKRPLLNVHAGQGVAFAADNERVYYVEVFHPMSLADYQARIYVEPPPYRK